MSNRESDDDLDRLGYFLPEDGQYQLKRLCGTLSFLVRLARPRSWDEEQQREPGVYVGDVAVCLELLAEQADQVLEELSWPATRQAMADEGQREAALGAVPPAPHFADGHLAFGITIDQIEALGRLVQTLCARGDAVGAGRTPVPADRTLHHSGQVLHDAAAAVQAILEQVRAQRLGRGALPGDRVEEAPGIYAVGVAAVSSDSRLPGGRLALSALSE